MSCQYDLPSAVIQNDINVFANKPGHCCERTLFTDVSGILCSFLILPLCHRTFLSHEIKLAAILSNIFQVVECIICFINWSTCKLSSYLFQKSLEFCSLSILAIQSLIQEVSELTLAHCTCLWAWFIVDQLQSGHTFDGAMGPSSIPGPFWSLDPNFNCSGQPFQYHSTPVFVPTIDAENPVVKCY